MLAEGAFKRPPRKSNRAAAAQLSLRPPRASPEAGAFGASGAPFSGNTSHLVKAVLLRGSSAFRPGLFSLAPAGVKQSHQEPNAARNQEATRNQARRGLCHKEPRKSGNQRALPPAPLKGTTRLKAAWAGISSLRGFRDGNQAGHQAAISCRSWNATGTERDGDTGYWNQWLIRPLEGQEPFHEPRPSSAAG